MRVCLVSGEYPPMQGGVGDYTRELARVMARKGTDVAVLTSRHTGKPTAGSAATTGSVRVLPWIERWNWSCWRGVRRAIDELRPDVLHIQYQSAAYGLHPAINFLPWRLRWNSTRPRVAVTFHDLRVPYVFPKAGPLRWWSVLMLARHSDLILVTNVADEDVLSAEPFGPSVLMIPIGSNIHPETPSDFDRAAWRNRRGYGPEAVVLCYFGFLNDSKGGEELIRAVAALVRRGIDAHLLMIGGKVGTSDPENREYLKRVETLIADLGLADLVQWTGFVEQSEVSASFIGSDICVLPYRDGVSYRRGSFMAALAHGLPIVTTRPRHLAEGLLDGENVMLVDAGDAEALVDAVAHLTESPELRQRLGNGAHQLSLRFGWERIAERTLEAYDAILAA